MIGNPRRLLCVAAAASVLLTAACTSSGPAPRSSGSSTPSGSSSTPGPSGSSSTPHVNNPAKPNIVFVLTDDLSWNLVPYMPHVLAMRKAGTTMSRFYVVDSLCCPSRASIFTGQYPHDTGVYTNTGADGGYPTYVKHGDESKSFALSVQKAGYQTAFMGKYLNGYQPTDKPAPGWNNWYSTGNGYNGFNYTMRQNTQQVRYGKNPDDYFTDVISRKGSNFIRAAAGANKPFLLELATFAPHKPAVAAPRDQNKFVDAKVPRGPAYDAKPTNPPSWLGFPALTPAIESSMDKGFRARVRAVQAIDKMIGDIEQTLTEAGVADNTYLVFGSDNGYHMGEYRLHPGKKTAFDTDTHVPLIVTGPKVPAGAEVSQFGTNIDIAPTFEQLTGATIPATVEGVSMAGVWHGQTPAVWQNAVLIEHHKSTVYKGDPDSSDIPGGDPPNYLALRTPTALYVHYFNGELEYYDTVRDPYELHNLMVKGKVPPSLRSTIAPLERALHTIALCHTAKTCQAAATLK